MLTLLQTHPLHLGPGVFIVTTFQMSNDITRLRVCGCPDAKSFIRAFKYYSLWPISDAAMRLLRDTAQKAKKVKSKSASDRYLECPSDDGTAIHGDFCEYSHSALPKAP